MKSTAYARFTRWSSGVVLVLVIASTLIPSAASALFVVTVSIAVACLAAFMLFSPQMRAGDSDQPKDPTDGAQGDVLGGLEFTVRAALRRSGKRTFLAEWDLSAERCIPMIRERRMALSADEVKMLRRAVSAALYDEPAWENAPARWPEDPPRWPSRDAATHEASEITVLLRN